MKLRSTCLNGMATLVIVAGCGGATSIDMSEYPEYGNAADTTTSTAQGSATVGTSAGGNTTKPSTSAGGSTTKVHTTVVNTSTGGTYGSKTTTWFTGTSKGGATTWVSTTSRGGATTWVSTTSKGGTTGWISTTSKGGSGGSRTTTWITSKGGTTSTTAWTYQPGWCLYGNGRYPNGATFMAEDGCTVCVCKSGSPHCDASSCSAGCDYFGDRLRVGDIIPSGDGCNSCSCQLNSSTSEGAVLSCTAMSCPSSCTYAGRSYADGATFLATDGCNMCACKNGKYSCAQGACGCDPESEYWREYYRHSSAECAAISFACPPGASAFSNACGCGCEQSPDCPDTVNCNTWTGVGPYGSGGTSGYVTAVPAAGRATAGGQTSRTYYSNECPSALVRASCPLTIGVTAL